MTKIKLAKCPSCVTKININTMSRLGQQIKCPECEAILEVVQFNPPLLDWVFENGDIFLTGKDYSNDEFSFEKLW